LNESRNFLTMKRRLRQSYGLEEIFLQFTTQEAFAIKPRRCIDVAI